MPFTFSRLLTAMTLCTATALVAAPLMAAPGDQKINLSALQQGAS